MPIDQYNDPAFGMLIKQAERMPAFGDFVKEADIESGERNTLPDSAFAWPEEKRFPLHTDKHAALSFAYAKVQPRVPPHVMQRIKEALDVYGVQNEIFAETGVKQAAFSDDAWLLPDLKLYPVLEASDVKVAELRVLNDIPKMDLDHRAIACTNLVKKAQEFGVQLHPETLKFAGMVVSSTKFASEWLEARSTAAPTSALKEAYAKLASEMRKQGEEIKDREKLVKVAAVIAELDEKAGFVKHYDRKMPDAIRTVFNTVKEAATSVDVAGRVISLAKLAALPASFWEDLGGMELSREVAPGGKVDSSKLAAVVDSLPLDLKLIIKSQVR